MSVAVVTGAERGIGLETARQLLERGFTVVLGTYDAAEAERAVRDLAASGEVHNIPLDVTDDRSIEAAFTDIGARFAALDVLVNNAGVTALGSASDVTRAQLRELFEVNTFGPAMVTRAALPLLRHAGHPRIVNVSSGGGSLARASAVATAGVLGVPILAYAASKAALNMITIQTHLTLRDSADLRHIKVNAVTPGTTATRVSGFRGQSPADGARVVVQLATIDDAGPSGGFFELTGPVDW